MRSVLVCAFVSTLVIACSDPTPPATHVGADESVVVAGSIPYATGVHTASLPIQSGCVGSALNDFDEVVGTCFSNAFKWERLRGLTMLQLPPTDTLGTGAFGVTNSGLVMVEAMSIDSGFLPATWSWSGNYRELRSLTSVDRGTCVPSAINDAGVIAGWCQLSHGAETPYATVWTPFGTPDGLHPGGGASLIQGLARAISDSDYIAGFYSPTGDAFLFTPRKEVVILARAPGATTMDVFGVNDFGQVAGIARSADPACPTRAVAWLEPNVVVDLGVCGAASAITDDGIVIGTAVPSGGQPSDSSFAFVWTATGGLQRLPNLLGHTFRQNSHALAINHKHQVLGTLAVGTHGTATGYNMMWTLP